MLIVIVAAVGAVFVAAVGQGAFHYVLPTIYDRIIGSTDIGTYALLAFLGALFLFIGATAPRWLRTPVPLVWMLFPVVAVYLLAILGQPYVYRCNPFNSAYVPDCWMIQSPFVVSAVAVAIGYVFFRRRSGRSEDAV